MESINRMKYYFEQPENLVRLRKALDEWIGTPYRHGQDRKGVGVDCINFVVSSLAESGGMDKVKIPDYAERWMFGDRALLRDGLSNSGLFEELPWNVTPMNGDVMLFHFGKQLSHSALYLDNFLYHVWASKGVVSTPFGDARMMARLEVIFRLRANK